MSTTYTTSSTSSFTVTHARYLASKMAADLRQMQLFYGKPSDSRIADFITEAVVLLLNGYLATVTYGFKRDGQWVVALRYNAHTSGVLFADERAGRVTPGVNISGATWYSFLDYSLAYFLASDAERQRIKEMLPLSRSSGEEPSVGGSWTSDRSYSSGGVSLQRQMYSQS